MEFEKLPLLTAEPIMKTPRPLRQVIYTVQGSNLALANLLNACSFLQKASRNCHHLLFLAFGNKSLSHNQIMQHSICCMANCVDPDQPASEEAG